MFHEPNVFNCNGQLNEGDFVLKCRDCVRECERESGKERYPLGLMSMMS